jgi:hypothetical protein
VAIKLLPASFSTDKAGLLASNTKLKLLGRSINPTSSASITWAHTKAHLDIVSESLQGETLRLRLAGGALPYRKATDYALQIATGLVADTTMRALRGQQISHTALILFGPHEFLCSRINQFNTKLSGRRRAEKHARTLRVNLEFSGN